MEKTTLRSILTKEVIPPHQRGPSEPKDIWFAPAEINGVPLNPATRVRLELARDAADHIDSYEDVVGQRNGRARMVLGAVAAGLGVYLTARYQTLPGGLLLISGTLYGMMGAITETKHTYHYDDTEYLDIV